MTVDDFMVGAANAERQRAHQHGAVAYGRWRDFVELD
jgi:hypothetical protein